MLQGRGQVFGLLLRAQAVFIATKGLGHLRRFNTQVNGEFFNLIEMIHVIYRDDM